MRMIRTARIFAAAITMATVCSISPSAQATLAGTVPVTPGTTVLPGLVASGTPEGTLLASLSEPFTTTLGTTTGTLTTAVYREATGTLDFYYQIANLPASVDAAVRSTASNFTGFLTSVGFRLDAVGPFVLGTIAPTGADSSLSGSVIGFNFGPPVSGEILPGQTSAIFVISTNATDFTTGHVSVIDGGVATVDAFQPIPEPASLTLLAGGIIGLGVVCQRANRKSA